MEGSWSCDFEDRFLPLPTRLPMGGCSLERLHHVILIHVGQPGLKDTTLKTMLTVASLVAQWLRILLLMPGTWVLALVWKIPHATEPLSPAPQLLSLCSRAREPQVLSPHAATTEARAPRARALQQEKPLQ